MALNPDKLNEFLGKAVVDFGATLNAALIRIGDRLGLYKALASGGPQTSAELAKRTGTAERYVREWLSAQAAGGYVTYDSASGKFSLSEEQAFTMADETSPAFLPGAFQLALAAAQRRRATHAEIQNRRGHGLARASSRTLCWHRAIFPPGLCSESDRFVDSCAARC